MLGKHKPQEPVRLSDDDFQESAFIFTSEYVQLDEKSLGKSLSRFIKKCSWRNGKLPIVLVDHSDKPIDGYYKIHLYTYHRKKDLTCSVSDWHEHFSGFLLHLTNEFNIAYSVVMYTQFDGTIQYWH